MKATPATEGAELPHRLIGRSSRLERGAIGASLAALALALTLSLYAQGRERYRSDAGKAAHAVVAAASAASAASAIPPAKTFESKLPDVARLESEMHVLLQAIHRAASQQQVRVISTTMNRTLPTEQTLPRIELSVVMAGAYPRIKTVLAEAALRFPGTLVPELEFKRVAQGTDVEATAVILRVAKPAVAETR